MDAKQQILYDKAVEVDDRITYFLLTITAAAVGYAVQKADALTGQLMAEIILAASAVLLWGASFTFGCLKLLAVKSVLQLNLRAVQLHELKAVIVNAGGVPTSEFLKKLDRREADMRKQGEMQKFWFSCQLWTIAGGAVGFIAWRVLAIFTLISGSAHA